MHRETSTALKSASSFDGHGRAAVYCDCLAVQASIGRIAASYRLFLHDLGGTLFYLETTTTHHHDLFSLRRFAVAFVITFAFIT
jgi:hypothetical protein